MSLLFAHDHKFRKIDGDYYSTGGLSDEVLSRYVNIYGEITVVARVIFEKKIGERYSKISNPKVRIVERKTLNNFQFNELVINSDYIISRLPSKIGSEVVRIALKNKKKYLLEMVACPWDAFWNHSFLGKTIAIPIFLVTRLQTRLADYTLYVTNNFLQRRYPTKGKSISCSDVSLNPDNLFSLDQRLKHINNHAGRYILGTIAAMDVKYKGQEYVIKAIGKLREAGIDKFEYQLVGNGDTSYLEKIVSDNNLADRITFLGGLPHSQVFVWLDKIDTYIQPSKQEGLPRALIEAMSRGLPCMGSTAGGIPELLEEDMVFPKGDYDALSIILKNLDDEILYSKAIRNYKVSKLYSNEVLTNKRNNFYRDYKSLVDEFKLRESK